MKRFLKTILSLTLFVIIAWAQFAHSNTYEVTIINVPDSTRTVATGINELGEIVGYYWGYDGYEHGFLLSGGSFTTFDVPGAIEIEPNGIDAQGRIVGIYSNPWAHGFLYDWGNLTFFDIPITIEGAIPVTYAYGINGQGDIVGRSMEVICGVLCWGYNDHGFIRNVNGGYTFFDLGLNLTIPYGINNQGQIVGQYLSINGFSGFLREINGAYIDLNFPGGEDTHPLRINDKGQIVGYYVDSEGIHNFIYEGGNFTLIEIDIPGAVYTLARGINNQGQIVGYYSLGYGEFHGFLATPMVLPFKISGGAYFYPETPTYRASFSMDVTGPSSPSGWLKYYYTRTRMNFVSTSITSASLSNNTSTISGTGTVNGVSGYTFTATVTNGSPDSFRIVIRRADGSIHYSAGPRNISGGDLVIQ